MRLASALGSVADAGSAGLDAGVDNKVSVDTSHQLRSLSFPTTHWQGVLDDAADGRFSMDACNAVEAISLAGEDLSSVCRSCPKSFKSSEASVPLATSLQQQARCVISKRGAASASR